MNMIDSTLQRAGSPIPGVGAAFERWIGSKGFDFQPWIDLMHEDVEFFSLARGREPLGFTRTARRRSAMIAYFRGLTDNFDMLDYTIERHIGDDDKVASFGESVWKFRQTGRVFRSKTLTMFWFDQNRITRIENYCDTAAMLDVTVPASRKSATLMRVMG